MKERMVEQYRPDTITRDLVTNEEAINKTKESDKTSWDDFLADDEAIDKKVRYRMKDVDIPATYETEVDYYDPTTIQIETELKGQKKWRKDEPTKRPKLIKVYLLANGEKVKEQSVTSRNNWTYRFTNIPVYDAAGEKIIYTVKEKPVSGYETTYEKFDIINLGLEPIDDRKGKDANKVTTSRMTRIGLFILGAAAITAGVLLDQVKKEE